MTAATAGTGASSAPSAKEIPRDAIQSDSKSKSADASNVVERGSSATHLPSAALLPGREQEAPPQSNASKHGYREGWLLKKGREVSILSRSDAAEIYYFNFSFPIY